MVTSASRSPSTQSSMARVVNDVDARPPRRQWLNYVYHPSFDDPGQESVILAPMQDAEIHEARIAQPELASLDVLLLNKDQELHLFRKMNFLKHKANRLLNIIPRPAGRLDARDCLEQDTIEDLKIQAQAIRTHLIHCNTRLLVSIAKRYATPNASFSELLSDGHLSLISAIENFDYSRGNKFSTYASWVLMKRFGRAIAAEKHRRMRFRTGREQWFFEAAMDTRADEKACMASAEQTRACINQLLELLEFL